MADISRNLQDGVYRNFADAKVRDALAEEFSTTESYAIGDYVLNDGVLYRFTSEHSAGAWDSSHVVLATIGEELKTKTNTEHTHNNIVSRGNVTAETGSNRPSANGLSMAQVYNNGYPTTYGNVISLKGQGDGEICVGWSGTSGERASTYLRSRRDTSDANWSNWYEVLDSGNYSNFASPTNHTHSYLPLSGGTMTGNATFNAGKNIQKAGESTSWINGRSTALVRVTTYTGYSAIISQKTTNGSWELGTYTDNKIYLTYTKDTNFSAGTNTMSQYCFPPLNDGTNANVASAVSSISRSGTTFTATRLDGSTFTFTQQDNNTTYSAGTGLGLSGTSFYIPIPRVAESCNALPGGASIRFREYTAGANYNLPSNHWYQILEIRSTDTAYGTQLALGMTVDAAYYRKYSSSSWGSWKSLINTDSNTTYSAGTDLSLSGTTFSVVSDTAATASKIVKRDANGYVRATYYNASCGSEAMTSYSGALPAFFSTDGWLRKSSASAFRSAIGLGNTTGAVPIANGGTGATTAAAARQNLFNESLASNGEYLIAITGSWAKGGYIAKGSVGSWIGGICARPNYTISATDLTAGTSALTTDAVYFVYA